jgi:hypothetical protein
VEDCEPAGLLADRVWIDLVGTDEAAARAKLREEVLRALRRAPGHRAALPTRAGHGGGSAAVPYRTARRVERALPAEPRLHGPRAGPRRVG